MGEGTKLAANATFARRTQHSRRFRFRSVPWLASRVHTD